MSIENIIDRIKLPFRKDKELYLSLYHILGFYPRCIEHYKLALMHSSAARKNTLKGRPANNERLEFLGDAVLDAVVGDIVYRHFQGKREGFLTNARSKIVQRETLGKLAHETGLDKLIHSCKTNKTHNSYMGGNAFEALVGAVYLDRGYDACMKFMEERILNRLIDLDKVAYKEVNFKSKLLEWCQKNKVQMQFVMTEQGCESGTSPVFRYRVVIEGVEGCDGKGYSKKESQQTASRLTMLKLRREPQFIDAIFAAKAERTKMEETPVTTVPDIEKRKDFIITTDETSPAPEQQAEETAPDTAEAPEKKKPAKAETAGKKSAEPTKEDIIAAAEEAAFLSEQQQTAE